MKDYFYEQISKCFNNVIYIKFGKVAIEFYSRHDGKGNDKAIRYVAYGIPTLELNKLSEEERKSHIKVDKTYDITDVNFNDQMNVLQKIHDTVKSFEMEVYS